MLKTTAFKKKTCQDFVWYFVIQKTVNLIIVEMKIFTKHLI